LDGVDDWAGEVERKLGIDIVGVAAGGAVARMPVVGNTQVHGRLHGGATMALGEFVGSLAANLHAAEHGKQAVGIEISGSHHREVRDGWVTARARAVHLGRTLATYEIAVTDEASRRISTIRFTAALLDPEPEPEPD
jgi:uncharacterized protein (TIGR00369 family)